MNTDSLHISVQCYRNQLYFGIIYLHKVLCKSFIHSYDLKDATCNFLEPACVGRKR